VFVISIVLSYDYEIMSELSRPQLRVAMLERAPQYYSDYRYHNFPGHVTQTMEDFVAIREWLAQQGIPIDEDLGLIALGYHDANFHLDEKKAGFSTKEEYSAWLARKDMRELGASNHTIRIVSSAIIKTTFNETPENVYAGVAQLFRAHPCQGTQKN
jgi:hypothetical protein